MKHSTSPGVTLDRSAPGFDAAVLGTSFNARDPGRRPDLVVQANDVFDVVAAVNRARREGLTIGICSGGHSWAQNHIRDGGLMLDLSRLNSLEIDSKRGVAIVGPGCLGGDLDAALAKANLFFPVAHAYTVGLGGFLLQGGFGWNSRVVGLACESVIGLDVVLADGSLVHASEDENPDLLWAARGAGPGFFGVVVRFHLKLHARPKFIGVKLQVFRMKHLEEVFAWADRIGPEVSPKVEFQMVLNRRAMGIFAPGIEVFAPVMAESRKAAREAVAFLSDGPLKPKASLTLPLTPLSLGSMMNTGEKTLFLPNTRWTADNMWMNGPIDPLLPSLRRMADTQPPAPSHVLWLNWNPPAQRPDMAFSMEARTYLALYCGVRDPAVAARHETWATDFIRSIEGHGVGIQLADENLARRPARFVSDANLARLDEIRAARDPEGRFHPWMGRPDL
ncbi:FAD-binding oxidoreductase [Phenylobacterium aquaticum]|uniref:FAD-binding oxidoreductase n=1 Tax=Phenylobacterium aquaticum TaxID=1763816 RepID=UPI001F5E0BDD|nr:FAD-binding oxidoreductase [Phenylobacterium aquaticum]